MTHFSGCSSLTDHFTESTLRSELLPLHFLPLATLTTLCVESGTSLSHMSLRETIMTPFTCNSEIDIKPWVKGCERGKRTVLCHCRAKCVYWAHYIELIPLFGWMTGTVLTFVTWPASRCPITSSELLLFLPLFISVFLLFSQVTSSSAFLSLSRSSSSLSGLLHNVQLYLLQLRILIFPTRQSARANQERRGKGSTFLTCLCALPR